MFWEVEFEILGCRKNPVAKKFGFEASGTVSIRGTVSA